MIKVWSDGLGAGLLDRFGVRGSTFSYDHGCAPERAVSATMPVRLASWDWSHGIHPIFAMNLPEGFLREKLRLAYAKATGSFDDLDLLAIVGRSQVGRLRYTAHDAGLDEGVPFQSVDEILRHRRDGDLFDFLMEKFAVYSGVSGVQPKVLIRDEEDRANLGRQSPSLRGATHIVKFWEPNEYPQLAANEFFCLRAAELAGLDVPRYRLSDDALALVIDRFDLRDDGTYRGVEDFCVLNGRDAEKKYEGSYEATLFKMLPAYVPASHQAEDLEKLFALFTLNVAVRNGDAHLKNFSLVYDDVRGPMRLSPVYDIVTTTAYIPKDAMALTLNGSSRWPVAKKLHTLGTTRCGLTPAQARAIMDRIADGVSKAAVELMRYQESHPEFREVGDKMLWAWADGMQEALGFDTPAWIPLPAAPVYPATTHEPSVANGIISIHRKASDGRPVLDNPLGPAQVGRGKTVWALNGRTVSEDVWRQESAAFRLDAEE